MAGETYRKRFYIQSNYQSLKNLFFTKALKLKYNRQNTYYTFDIIFVKDVDLLRITEL